MATDRASSPAVIFFLVPISVLLRPEPCFLIHSSMATPPSTPNTSQRVLFEERLQLERLRASVMKEQAELRVERACWERDRLKGERDELATRLARLQAVLDRERRQHRFANTPTILQNERSTIS